MYGFTQEALILLPKPDSYYGKDEYWKLRLRESLSKAIAFINKIVGAKACAFTSDEVAVDLLSGLKNVEWWNALPPEDCNFARRNCEGLRGMPEGLDFDEEYDMARTKYPIKGNLEIESRFEIAVKREKLVANHLIKKCKLVITFENQNNAAFKVEKNTSANRAVFIVNHLNFIVTAYFAGEPIDNVGFIGQHWATAPMNSWEV